MILQPSRYEQAALPIELRIHVAALEAPLQERRSQCRQTPVERLTGIEPALSAWEADLLPLQHSRILIRDESPVRRYAISHSACFLRARFSSRET